MLTRQNFVRPKVWHFEWLITGGSTVFNFSNCTAISFDFHFATTSSAQHLILNLHNKEFSRASLYILGQKPLKSNLKPHKTQKELQRNSGEKFLVKKDS